MDQLNLTKKYQTYPEYKDSGVEWIGKIPKGWGIERTKSIFAFRKEIVGNRKDEFKILSLTLKGVIPRDMENIEGKFPADYGTYQIARPNDLVMCLFDMDVTPRTVGYVGETGLLTSAYRVFKPKPNVHTKYYYYYQLFLDTTKELLHFSGGLRSSISKESFLNLPAPILPFEQQKKIANYLDGKTVLIDEIIDKKQKLIELLKEKRSAIIHKTVTKGLDEKTELVESKVEWVGKVPKGWKIRRVKELFEIKRGRVISKEKMSDEYNYPVYSSQTKNNGCMGYINTFDFDRSAITWTTDGANAGTVFYRDGKFNCTNVCGVLIPKNNQCLKYFAHSIQISATPNKRLDTNGYKIMSNEMKDIAIAVPSEIEQEKIATYLDKNMLIYDEAINLTDQSIDVLQEFKSSLISNVVTGKIKISN